MLDRYEDVVIFELGASMFFANVEYMREEVEKMLDKERDLRPVKVIIISFSKVNSIDTTALYIFKELFEVWNKRKYKILVAEARGEIAFVVRDHFIKYLV